MIITGVQLLRLMEAFGAGGLAGTAAVPTMTRMKPNVLVANRPKANVTTARLRGIVPKRGFDPNQSNFTKKILKRNPNLPNPSATATGMTGKAPMAGMAPLANARGGKIVKPIGAQVSVGKRGVGLGGA